jgi:putative phosphoesterase
LADIRQREIETIFCTGDIVGYYPHPLECVDLVRKNCSQIIQGNHDEVITSKKFSKEISWFNEAAARSLKWTRERLLQSDASVQYHFLETLQARIEISLEDRPILLVHGTPDEKWEYFLFPYWSKDPLPEQRSQMLKWLKKWHLVLLGHTHQAFIYKTRKKVVLNPGSVGQPRDGDCKASYAVVDISKSSIKPEIIRLEYDIEKTCEAISRENLDAYLCERLYSGI